MARALWPLALLVPLVGAIQFPVFTFGDYTAGQTIGQIAVVGVGIVLAGYAIGGRDGLGTALVLSAIATYCAWWLSLGIDHSISAYTWARGAEGLNRWARYVGAAAVNVWPLILASCVAVVLAGRQLAVPPWRAVGLLALTLLVLATPFRADWSDGCNSHVGPAPAVLTPVVPQLMDSGIGVMPDYDSTQADCFRPNAAGKASGDGPWKPFWKGDDGLPS